MPITLLDARTSFVDSSSRMDSFSNSNNLTIASAYTTELANNPTKNNKDLSNMGRADMARTLASRRNSAMDSDSIFYSNDVGYVIDADTFTINQVNGDIRLFGADAPETSTEAKIAQYEKYGQVKKAEELRGGYTKSGDFFGRRSTKITEDYLSSSNSYSLIDMGEDFYGRSLYDVKSEEGKVLSVELLRQGGAFTALPGDRYFERDEYSEERLDAFIEAYENNKGIFSRRKVEDPAYTRYKKKLEEGAQNLRPVADVNIRRKLEYYIRNREAIDNRDKAKQRFKSSGLSNPQYAEILANEQHYFTLRASRGSSAHYQQSLHKNLMQQGGYKNLVNQTPFEGVATALVRTNTQYLTGKTADSATIFIAQQFDKGLYTPGLGEFLNSNLFIPNGFGRAYKDERGFVGSIAGFAGRMLDESYLYYTNITPDVMMIGNEFQEGQGMGPMTGGREGLFESTFTRAAEYTVAAAQSLGMYVAITQPIDMLKASIYKDALDSTLTQTMRSGLLKNNPLDYAVGGYYFGFVGSQPSQVLERMFEVDAYNEQVTKLSDDRKIRVKQTGFFDHDQAHGTGFTMQQFVTRGRARVMLEATFKPLLKEIVNPFDIGVVNEETGASLYKKYNKAVDNLIDVIAEPAGMVANFDSGARFTFIPKDQDVIKSTSGNLELSLIGSARGSQSVVAPIIASSTDGTTPQGPSRITINVGLQSDISVGSYSELQFQYTRITRQLDTHIDRTFKEVMGAKTEVERTRAVAELQDLKSARAQVQRRLGEAFEVMSIETKGIGVGRKIGIARATQAVLDLTPLNPFKWGILGGKLDEKAGTLMIGQLFSFDETARMAEAAITGDGALNRIFRKAQATKIAEFKREGDAGSEHAVKYARTYNIQNSIFASMKTVDNLGEEIWTSAKDFAGRQAEGSKSQLIRRASANLRRAERATVAKRGFIADIIGNFFGNFDQVDASAIAVDKEQLLIKKRGTHVLGAIADYEEALQRNQGLSLDELGKNLDAREMEKTLRMSGTDNIQLGINKILEGKGTNLSAELVSNRRIKGIIAGLVFTSIVGNSIFQSTGGASIISQLGMAVYGEKADIALEFEGNRFLPTEFIHTFTENTFGAAPSLMAMNTISEIGFIAGTTYAANRIAVNHSYYQTIQYSYAIDDIQKMSANGEQIRLMKKTSGVLEKASYEEINISKMSEAAEEIATNSAVRQKLYLEIIEETGAPPKYISVTANAKANVFTTGKILQAVTKDVGVNTMIYASVALLATSALREVAANTLQMFAASSNDNNDNRSDLARGFAAMGTIVTGAFFTAGYIKKHLVDDVLQEGNSHKKIGQSVADSLEEAKRNLPRVNKRLAAYKQTEYTKVVEVNGVKTRKKIKKIFTQKAIKRREKNIQLLNDQFDRYSAVIADENVYEDFLSTRIGKKYQWLEGDSFTAKLARGISPTKIAVASAAAGILATSAALYVQSKDTDVDYSGTLDPLVGLGLGIGVGLAVTKSPVGALAIGAITAVGAYYANWAGIKVLKIGNAGRTVDEDATRMISQLARFTKAVTSNLDGETQTAIETSGYVSQFSKQADKALYGKSENPKDRVRVIAKQVPLPMLQFFVAEKIAGDSGQGIGASLDNKTTNRVYSVGVQSGALFGMSMSLQMPVMYTPGRGFNNFSYNPDHNLDKLPNALATMAAYSNIYLGTMATIGAVGGLLPGKTGRAFKHMGQTYGDFNRAVQNVTRKVNGFYIEQVARTFTKLNLIDTQLLLQGVSDKVYKEARLDSFKVEAVNKIDNNLKTAFPNTDGSNSREIRLKNNQGVIKAGELNVNTVQINFIHMEEADQNLVKEVFEETKRVYYNENNLGVVERRLIDNNIGSIIYDKQTTYKQTKFVNALNNITKFSRKHAANSVIAMIAGGFVANLINTAIAESNYSINGTAEERAAEAAKRDIAKGNRDAIISVGAVGAMGAYLVATEFGPKVVEKTGNFIVKKWGDTPLLKGVRNNKRVLNRIGLGGALLAANFTYNFVKTSSKFGIAKYMDRRIQYANDGSGAIRDPETQSIIYEASTGHHIGVAGMLTAYTTGMFMIASGPFRSIQDTTGVLMTEFEGKPNAASRVWETLSGGHRKALAIEQAEGLLYDIARLQFNDLDEFKAFHNLDVDLENPMLSKALQQDETLYNIKASIKSEIGQDLPNDFIYKYMGFHQKVKENALKDSTSLIDATKYLSPEEANEYKAFMKAVGKTINDFGTSRPGALLSRSKFTRNLSGKIAATLGLMAVAREIFRGFDNMSQDPLGRKGKPGMLDRLYNQANKQGMYGQTKPGGGTVGLGEGFLAMFADATRIITGRDRIDIGVIAEGINGAARPVMTESLIGTTADYRSAQQLLQEVGAGFVLDDSNAYLAIGTFGGVTFRQGDYGFRTSSYFQLQSAGQDISTATYTMATKFFHGSVASEGVMLSNLVDAATRGMNDDKTSLTTTALLIRTATSMQHPLKNIRKMSKTPGSMRGDRLANIIRNAREEAGRQLNRQNISSIYTENYFTQMSAFEQRVGGDFYKKFINRIATQDATALSLLSEVLSGAYGYNPQFRGTVSNVIFFSMGKSSRKKRNKDGENVVLLGEGAINLTYQNEQFSQSRSSIFDYTFNSLNSMIDQSLLNFLPDVFKKSAKLLLVVGAGMSLLTAAASWMSSREFADKMTNQDFTNTAYQFTAHEDVGGAVNLSPEKQREIQRQRAQMGDTLYDLGEEKLFDKLDFEELGDESIEEFIKKARAEGRTESFEQLLSERTQKNLGAGKKGVITLSDMNNNISFRFQMSEAIKYAKPGTLKDITRYLSLNQSFRIVKLDGNQVGDFRNRLWGVDFIERDLTTAGKGDIVGHLKSLKAQSPGRATEELFNITKNRITSTYSEMIQELYGGSFNTETGRLDFTSVDNRYLQEVQMKPTVDGMSRRSQTVFEMINGTFSDADVIAEMQTNTAINESMLKNKAVLNGETTLGQLPSSTDEYILQARRSLAAKMLDGDAARSARQFEIEIHELIDKKLRALGIEIDADGTIKTNVFEYGKLNERQLIEQVQAITVEVVDQVEAEGKLNSIQRHMGVLEVESANSVGRIQRIRDNILKRQRAEGKPRGLIGDVAQFRGAKAVGAKGLGTFLKGGGAVLEAFGLLNDVVQAVDLYGAYARIAESYGDPFQTEQDVIMARRELGKSLITAGIGIAIAGVQGGILKSLGWMWKKTNMNLGKAIAGGIIGIPAIGILGGAVYKGLIKPAMQATGRILNESEAVKNIGDTFNQVYNTVADSAGFVASMPVEWAHKWGVTTFGPETGKKVTFAAAGAMGGGMGMGGILAGIAIGGGLFGLTLSAPVTLAALGIGFFGGMLAGFVFEDGNAAVTTKILQEIPKIPVIGGLLGGLIVTPYKSIRSEERFKHHYRNSPFTVGYAGEIVNQKWLALLAANDDPSGADLVSNMFGEIIRGTEYETSAWKINSSRYGANPIPIVDGVVERELRLRASYYGDLMIGKYSWGQILKNSDQSGAIEKQIAQAKAKEVEIINRNKVAVLKNAKQGGSSVPTGAAVPQNNNGTNTMIDAEITAQASKEQLRRYQETSVTYKVKTTNGAVQTPKDDQTELNQKLVLKGGFPTIEPPMQKLVVFKGHVEEDGDGSLKVGVTKEEDPSSVVREMTLASATEGQDYDPSVVSQQRSYLMMTDFT